MRLYGDALIGEVFEHLWEAVDGSGVGGVEEKVTFDEDVDLLLRALPTRSDSWRADTDDPPPEPPAMLLALARVPERANMAAATAEYFAAATSVERPTTVRSWRSGRHRSDDVLSPPPAPPSPRP